MIPRITPDNTKSFIDAYDMAIRTGQFVAVNQSNNSFTWSRTKPNTLRTKEIAQLAHQALGFGEPTELDKLDEALTKHIGKLKPLILRLLPFLDIFKNWFLKLPFTNSKMLLSVKTEVDSKKPDKVKDYFNNKISKSASIDDYIKNMDELDFYFPKGDSKLYNIRNDLAKTANDKFKGFLSQATNVEDIPELFQAFMLLKKTSEINEQWRFIQEDLITTNNLLTEKVSTLIVAKINVASKLVDFNFLRHIACGSYSHAINLKNLPPALSETILERITTLKKQDPNVNNNDRWDTLSANCKSWFTKQS